MIHDEREKGYSVNVELITEYMKKHNLSISDLAKKCRIEEKEMQKVFGKSLNYPLICILRLSRIMGVGFSKMFK